MLAAGLFSGLPSELDKSPFVSERASSGDISEYTHRSRWSVVSSVVISCWFAVVNRSLIDLPLFMVMSTAIGSPPKRDS